MLKKYTFSFQKLKKCDLLKSLRKIYFNYIIIMINILLCTYTFHLVLLTWIMSAWAHTKRIALTTMFTLKCSSECFCMWINCFYILLHEAERLSDIEFQNNITSSTIIIRMYVRFYRFDEIGHTKIMNVIIS